MSHAINWFELPTQNLDRAARFYQTLLGIELKREVFAGVPHAIFPRAAKDDVIGALIEDAKRQPSSVGTLLYLNANGKLDACLARLGDAGGKVVLPKTSIGPMGFIAIVADTEGNHVGLHSA